MLIAGFVVAILAAGVASEWVGGLFPYALFVLLSAVNMIVVWPRAWRWLWRFHGTRLERAFDRNDSVRAARMVRRLAAEAPQMRDWAALNLAILPLLDERWREGIDALRALDRDKLAPGSQVMLDNSLAWGLTHDGSLDEAVALAGSTVERARADATLSPLSLGACIGTLGVALTRAGRHEEGLRRLQEAIAFGGRRRTKVSRLFYVGEAARALGREAEARDAFAEAARLAPDSRFGRRAAERLKSAPAVPYR